MIFNNLESVKNVLEDGAIGSSTKLVYVLVAANGGALSVGQRLISERYGINRATLRSAVKALEAKGYLKVSEGTKGRELYTCIDVPAKPRIGGRRKAVNTGKSFDLTGIIKCCNCETWIDVEKCEKVDTAAMDNRLAEDLETSPVGDFEGYPLPNAEAEAPLYGNVDW